MCGFLAVYGNKNYDNLDFKKSLLMQTRRGPDHQQITRHGSSVLGHARLSINDLSGDGHQPMFDSSGRYSLIFNGEIYNFNALRHLVESDFEIQGSSDTEVLLNLLIKFGIKETLGLIEGMFSFCFYDIESQKVYFARDLAGEKPFYYSTIGDSFSVSSNLFSLISLYNTLSIDESVLSDFLHYGYCKGEGSIINNIKKVPPSHWGSYDVKSKSLHFNRYDTSVSDVKEYTEKYLSDIISNSVNNTLIADVPVGCFLSGGVDSSLIASFAVEKKPSIIAFNVGFEDPDYDESEQALLVANHLNMQLKTLYLSPERLVQSLRDIRDIFDEPFADASSLATYELSKFAKLDVGVCLSGDGGDELFSGYNRHVLIPKIYNRLKYLPRLFRRSLSFCLRASFFRKSIRYILSFFKVTIPNFDEKLDKIDKLLGFSDYSDLVFRVLAGENYSEQLGLPCPKRDYNKFTTTRKLAIHDFESYLNEDVLVKVDRCSMAASLEARAPLLNRDIINFSRMCEDVNHVNGKQQKYILRKILKDRVPGEILNAPKNGFSVPYKLIVDDHIKTEALDIFNMLSKYETGINFDGMFELFNGYYSKKHTDYKLVWNIYCFLIWFKEAEKIVKK